MSTETNSVGGQLHGDKERFFSVNNQSWQSLEEGAGKRGRESHSEHRFPAPSSKGRMS